MGGLEIGRDPPPTVCLRVSVKVLRSIYYRILRILESREDCVSKRARKGGRRREELDDVFTDPLSRADGTLRLCSCG